MTPPPMVERIVVNVNWFYISGDRESIAFRHEPRLQNECRTDDGLRAFFCHRFSGIVYWQLIVGEYFRAWWFTGV